MLLYFLSLIESDEDKAFFTSLYLNYQNMMFGIAQNILHDSGLSEDAVNTAFLNIINHFEFARTRDEEKIKGYIIVVVQNAAKQIHNKQKKYLFIKKTDCEYDCNYESNFFAKASKIDDNFDDKIDYTFVLDAIKEMPSIYSEVLLLRFYHGCSSKEAGKILGINETTVRKRIERARIILREKISVKL